MKLKALTPMLWTNDLRETIEFYQNILGFEIAEYNESWAWCSLYKDEVNIMFAVPNESTHFNGYTKFTGSFYMLTEEVDEAWELLKDQATIGYTLDNFEHGMREFAILDNNGYMLQFGRELKEGEKVIE